MTQPEPRGVRQRVLDSTDVDEVRAVLDRSLDCEHVLYPYEDPQRFHARHELLQFERQAPVAFWWVDFGTPVRLIPHGVNAMVHIPSGGAIETIGLRERTIATSTNASVTTPGKPVRLNWAATGPSLLVWMDAAALETQLGQILGRPLKERLTIDIGQDLTRPEMRSWVDLVKMVARDAQTGPGLFSHAMTSCYVQHLIAGSFLAAARHSHSEPLHEATDRDAKPQTIRRATTWIEEHVADDITPEQVAAAVGVAARTLRDGFRRHVGMSPRAYITRVRLEHARQDLIAGGRQPTVFVTEVAQRYGFNPSRFAQLFREAFGVSPSSMLRG